MSKTRKILVIGGNGFIGQNIINRANDLEWNTTNLSYNNDKTRAANHFIKADIGDISSLEKNLTDKSYDYIVNCGGYVDHSTFSKNGIDILNTHFGGVMNILHMINKSSLKKFINLGSGDEYGSNKSPQLESFRENPNSTYSFAKMASSHFLQMLNRTEGIPTTSIRLFLVYGPGQMENRFIPQIIKGCLQNKSFPTSSGTQIRDFCYIDDVIEAIFLALFSKKAEGQILNIGSGNPIQIRRIVMLINNIIGKGNPVFGDVPLRILENMSLFPEINLAKEILDWVPATSIQDGLTKTIDSFNE